MENQHRKIVGYRELDEGEIQTMNDIKVAAKEIGDMVDQLFQDEAIDKRWLSIGKTHLQQGFMALTRAVAKPDFF